MKNLDLTTLLRGDPYPERGIVLDSSPEREESVIAYFIMGCSENSHNWVFVETPDGIRIQAFNPSKMTDPPLIIYAPVWVFDTSIIVTNGDQTDTIREGLAAGKAFAQAFRTRTFEPDAPSYIPRISGLVKKNGDYILSILKSAGGNPAFCHRHFFAYEAPCAGRGHFIHTYMGGGTPLFSSVGEPEQVEIPCGTSAEPADLL